MKLDIVKYLEEHGLKKTIVDFKLKCKEYPHKISLKYSKEADFSNNEVREARGLVLERDTWKPMSVSFFKFFNYGEDKAAVINWQTSKVFEKLDGTLIHVYYDYVLNKFCFGTTGSAEGERFIRDLQYTDFNGTFLDLFIISFIDTIKKNNKDFIIPKDKRLYLENKFSKYIGMTIIFELCTPYNIILTNHKENLVYLIGARNIDTLDESSFIELENISKDIGIPLAKTFDINTINEVKETFINMSFEEEGYVVCDYGKSRQLPRIKIKNPEYVLNHYQKYSDSIWNLINIVKSGEDAANEYKATIIGRKKELIYLQNNYNTVKNKLKDFSDIIKSTSEYVEFTEHISKILIDDKNIPDNIKNKFKELGLTKASDVNMPIEELSEFFMNEHVELRMLRAKNLKRKIHSFKEDKIACSLKKNLFDKINKLIEEKILEAKYLDFFLLHTQGINADEYLLNHDSKKLYYSLMEGFE